MGEEEMMGVVGAGLEERMGEEEEEGAERSAGRGSWPERDRAWAVG